MKNIKTNLLIKNILILLVSGLFTKLLGMISKILYTRIAGISVVSLYTLITPTLMLIISICQFSFPISISKLSAEDKYNNKSLLKNAYFIGIIINIIMIIIILLFSNKLAISLKKVELENAIKIISIISIPITISSIQRGFLHGKEDMLITSISNIVEEIIKILLIIFLLPYAIKKSNILAIIFLILFNLITESISIILMSKKIKKKYINSNNNKINKTIINDILSISLPTTLIRMVSLLGFFLEPIILTNLLIKDGLTINYITEEYGIINSYIIPLLSLPSFFCISIASALLPNLTKLYYKKDYKDFNKKLIKLNILSILTGFICLTLIMLFPKFLLKTIYNIDKGLNYLYLVAPFFLLTYIQPTLSAAIQAMNKTNNLFRISIITVLLKFISLYIFIKKGYKMNSLLFSMMIGIISTTLQEIIIVIKKPD